MSKPLSLIVNKTEKLDASGDTVWQELRKEAEAALTRTPVLAKLFTDAILDQPSLEAAVRYRIAIRLKNDTLDLPALLEIADRALAAEPEIGAAIRADLTGVIERDPATERLIEPFLYFKGFHAIQTHRLAHWLWRNGDRDLALYLQSRSSDVFQTDIHPAARFGKGIFLDHATGLVVGETAVVEDDISLLQNVTLGGTGKDSGERHPKVRRGAMIGAGAKILGNIEIGRDARIAAGAVVLKSVPDNATAAGMPAQVIRTKPSDRPPLTLEESLHSLAYETFAYSI